MSPEGDKISYDNLPVKYKKHLSFEEQLEAAAEKAAAGLTPTGDLNGSVEYRLEMTSVLARRALSEASARALSLESQDEHSADD